MSSEGERKGASPGGHHAVQFRGLVGLVSTAAEG